MQKTEKEFDAVQMMRELRDKMSADIAGMSYEEEKRYLEDRLQLTKTSSEASESSSSLHP